MDGVGEEQHAPVRLGDGLVPRAVRLQDLRPVHEALAAVGHEVGLGGAPAVAAPRSTRRRGAGRTHPGTTRSRRSRRCRWGWGRPPRRRRRAWPRRAAAGRGRCHRGRSPPAPGRAARTPAGRDRRTAEPRGGSRSRVPLPAETSPATSASRNTGTSRKLRGRAVLVRLRDEPLRPRQPPAGPGDLAAQQQQKDEPERAARGAVEIGRTLTGALRTLPGQRALGVSADEVGGHGESLEVRGVQ